MLDPVLHDHVWDSELSFEDGIWGFAGTAKDEDDSIVELFIPVKIFEECFNMLWKNRILN